MKIDIEFVPVVTSSTLDNKSTCVCVCEVGFVSRISTLFQSWGFHLSPKYMYPRKPQAFQ